MATTATHAIWKIWLTGVTFTSGGSESFNAYAQHPKGDTAFPQVISLRSNPLGTSSTPEVAEISWDDGWVLKPKRGANVKVDGHLIEVGVFPLERAQHRLEITVDGETRLYTIDTKYTS